MSSKDSVLTTGEILGVMTPAHRGRLMLHTALTLSIGGSEFNVAMALARLQQSVMFTGRVGADPTGQLAIDLLRGAGVDISGIGVDPQAQTGWYIKEFYGLSDEPRVYYYRRHSAARDWMPPGLDELPTGKAVGWVHTSGITLMLDAALSQRVQDFVMQWAARDIPVSLDINYRQALGRPDEWRQAIRAVLPFVTVLLGSRTELEVVLGTSPGEKMPVGTLPRTVVVKDHRQAQVYHGGDLVADIPALPVPGVVDVVGAGDGFSAGLIAG